MNQGERLVHLRALGRLAGLERTGLVLGVFRVRAECGGRGVAPETSRVIPKGSYKVRIFSDGLQGVTEKFLVCIFCTRNVFHSLIE